MKEYARDHLENLCDGVSGVKAMAEDFFAVYVHNDQLTEDVEHRINQLNHMFSSNLVWQIDDYKRRMSDAKIGKKPTIFSAPFYSGRHGYKMAASVALYGDGAG